MINTADRRLQRQLSGLPDTLSAGAYNAILMGLVVYGFLVNAAMVAFLSPLLFGIDYVPFLIGYVVCCIAGTLCAASEKPAMSFLGYNLIVLPIGVMLCQVIPVYGQELVMQAILLTGAISLTMLVLAALCPHWFAGIGRTLAISLGAGLVLSLASWLLGFSDNFLVWGFAIIFTLYIGYDLARSQACPRTLDNAIDSTLDIYLDIINLFLRILRILARFRSRD